MDSLRVMEEKMSSKDLIAEARECCADKSFNRTYEADVIRRLANALEARQVDEAALSKLILRSLVFTNDASKPWADNLARAVVEFLGERHEPEPGKERKWT